MVIQFVIDFLIDICHFLKQKYSCQKCTLFLFFLNGSECWTTKELSSLKQTTSDIVLGCLGKNTRNEDIKQKVKRKKEKIHKNVERKKPLLHGNIPC